MAYIDTQLLIFKQLMEKAIVTGGSKGKQSIIRSSGLINLIHDAVKYELIKLGINEDFVYPSLGNTKPEIKLAGFLKQKKQDVCVIPGRMKKVPQIIDWGPLGFQEKQDEYGYEFTTNTLVINVRSQMSSLAKNSDTLFERTFAEAQNLHSKYPEIVLGEVYLIPTHEYDDNKVKEHKVEFKERPTDIEKYICFFDSLNNRKLGGHDYLYERCTLLVVDFNRPEPKLYRNSSELIMDGLIAPDFEIEYSTLGFDDFASDILDIYSSRYDINNFK